MTENTPTTFERLPSTTEERVVAGRPTRGDVLDYFADRFGIPPETFEQHTFWEKGAGKIWVVAGTVDSPVAIEALGLLLLRTRQEHWKPTTNGIQRFGGVATRNVVELEPAQATRFVAGEDQPLNWEGAWGYVLVVRRFTDRVVPLGVGLFIDGELRSQIPKARRIDPICE